VEGNGGDPTEGLFRNLSGGTGENHNEHQTGSRFSGRGLNHLTVECKSEGAPLERTHSGEGIGIT
jgi:hypothetical protein